MGVAWLLDGLWRQLGVDTALARVSMAKLMSSLVAI